MEKQVYRNSYYDFLKGIAIVFVVAIHAFGVVYKYDNLNIFAICVRQLLNCAVPIFCASSAFFLAKKNFDIRTNSKKVWTQILRVYVPFLVCSFPFFCKDILNQKTIFFSILKYITCSYSIYYFVALIIQFYLILSFFNVKLFKYKIIYTVISILYWFIYVYFVRSKITVPIVVYAGIILGWVVYFSFGISYALNPDVNKLSLWSIIICLLFSLLLSCLEAYYLTNKTQSLSGLGIKPSAILFSLFCIIIMFGTNMENVYKSIIISKPFEIIGRYSYGIYLIHIYILEILVKLAKRILNTELILNCLKWIGLTIITLSICFVFLAIIKFLSKRIAKYGFGVV